ncbi:MAG: UDP-2,3-diacylglucosamine diphosphatase LpxI [Pseudomonadota bacterium]
MSESLSLEKIGELGLIAGGGPIPLAVIDRFEALGLPRPHVFPISGDACEELYEVDHTPISVVDLPKVIQTCKRRGISTVTLIGTIKSRPKATAIRPSWTLLSLLPRAIRALRGGDDGILSVVVAAFEQGGLTVFGVHELFPDLLCEVGPLGRIKPSAKMVSSIQKGFHAAKALGAMDAGQGVVVLGRRIVALEGAEGTDAMLARVADLKKIGRLPDGKGGILVKVSKPSQELRVDMPTSGPKTIEGAIAASLDGVALEAGKTLVADRAEMIAKADEHRLFIVGTTDDDISA